MSQRVRINDVASRAGVSTTTVSHVLNDVPGKRITPSTRERVRTAAVELGYVPNGVARSLRTQRTQLLALISDEVLTTPFAVEMILGAQEAASASGRLLVLVNTGVDRAIEAAEIEALQQRQVDGFLYMRMFNQSVRLPPGLRGSPTVLVDGTCPDPTIPSVVPDEFGGGLSAVREFVRQGHTKIAFINSVDDIPASCGRLAGYRAGLEEAGIPFRPDYVRRAKPEAAEGFHAADDLLRLADPPGAIFAFSDRMAMGVYHAAAEHELRIPTELSVIGFDNQHSVADGMFPGLTTLALPHLEMGGWGVRTLVRQIEEQVPPPAEHRALTCPLVVRGSVAPPSPRRPMSGGSR